MGSALPFLLSGDGIEGAGEGGREGGMETGQHFQPQLVVRRNSWRPCLQQPLKGQLLHGNIFTHVDKKPQSDKSHIIKITVLISWAVLQVKSICFWVKNCRLFLGVRKSIHVDFEHFG